MSIKLTNIQYKGGTLENNKKIQTIIANDIKNFLKHNYKNTQTTCDFEVE